MSRRLIISDGTREREMQLVGRVVVGRDPTCEISHDHSLLSRRHAEFVTAGNDVTVRDLGSRNGVFVNGVKAAERSLSPGDVVQIGPLRALYVTDLVSAGITPEQFDVERTAMLQGSSSAPARPSAVVDAAADDDDEVTRLMRAPGRSTAPRSADTDDEQTRYVRAPAAEVDAAGTVAIAMAPAAIAPSAAPVAATRSATQTATTSTFVFLQLLMFAGVLLAAAAVPFVMWRREIQSIAGAAGDSVSLGWLAIPGAVALAATYVVGAAINRRFAQAQTAKRNRT